MEPLRVPSIPATPEQSATEGISCVLEQAFWQRIDPLGYGVEWIAEASMERGRIEENRGSSSKAAGPAVPLLDRGLDEGLESILADDDRRIEGGLTFIASHPGDVVLVDNNTHDNLAEKQTDQDQNTKALLEGMDFSGEEKREGEENGRREETKKGREREAVEELRPGSLDAASVEDNSLLEFRNEWQEERNTPSKESSVEDGKSSKNEKERRKMRRKENSKIWTAIKSKCGLPGDFGGEADGRPVDAKERRRIRDRQYQANKRAWIRKHREDQGEITVSANAVHQKKYFQRMQQENSELLKRNQELEDENKRLKKRLGEDYY